MKRKELRIEKFLGEMDAVVPWDALISRITPYYQGITEQNKSCGDRPSHGVELMLRKRRKTASIMRLEPK